MNCEKRTSSSPSRQSPELNRAVQPWSDSEPSADLCLPAASIASLVVLSKSGEAAIDCIYRSHRGGQWLTFSLSVIETASSIVSG